MSCYSSCASQIRSSVPFIPVKERQSLHCLRTGAILFWGWQVGERGCAYVWLWLNTHSCVLALLQTSSLRCLFRMGRKTPSKCGNLSSFLLVIKMFPTPVLKSFWNYWCHMLLSPITRNLIQALGMLDKSSTPYSHPSPSITYLNIQIKLKESSGKGRIPWRMSEKLHTHIYVYTNTYIILFSLKKHT